MRRLFLIVGVLLSSIGAYSQVKFLKSFYLNSPSAPTVSHNGKMLYISSLHDIVVYTINQKTGELTKKYSHHGDEEFTGIYLSPDDKFLYTRTHLRKNGKNVSTFLTFSCDPISGKLSLINSFAQQDNTNFDYNARQYFSPNGNLMFIADNHGDDLYVYRRGANGSLTHLNSIHGQSSTFYDFTFSPDGKFMYTTGMNIYREAMVFRIDENSGQVTKVQDIVNNLYPQEYAKVILISPDGKNVYTVHTEIDPYSDYQPSDIFQYSRDPQSGVLTLQKHYPHLKKRWCD